MLLKLFIVFMFFLMASVLQSCAQIGGTGVDVKKMTYKALRQHDCRINEPNEFCSRGYSNEYAQYERLRAQYLSDNKILSEQYHQASNNQRLLEIW